MTDTRHEIDPLPPDETPVFDVKALERIARDDELLAREARQLPVSPEQQFAAAMWAREARLIRDAIAAYQALGDRLVNTTILIARGRIEQLEAQLAWIFRGDVVRNHLPICRADAEAQTAAETEGA